MTKFFVLIFRLLAVMPLWLLQGLGWVVGWLSYGLSTSYRQRLQDHLQQAGYLPYKHRAIGHAGCMVAELPRVWLGQEVAVRWVGREHIVQTHAAGRPMIFMSGHLGGYEISAQELGKLMGSLGQKLLVLYRPARKEWLQPLVSQARAKSALETVPATMAGVRSLLRALKQGQSLAIASDQVPPVGMGEWAPFFGRPAYTMTLASKLVRQTGAQLMMITCKRLPWGQGFEMRVEPWVGEFSGDAAQACGQMNQALEAIIGQCPEQYLWGYARYKQPAADKIAA